MVKSPEKLYDYLVKNDYVFRGSSNKEVLWEEDVLGDILIFTLGNPKTDFHKDAETESEIIISENGSHYTIREFNIRLPTVDTGHGKKIKNELNLPDGFLILDDGRPMSGNIKGKVTPHVYAKERADFSDIPTAINKVTEWYWKQNNHTY